MLLFVSILMLYSVQNLVVRCVKPDFTSFDQKINALINRMSDEEKVGQMTQVTIDLILENPSLPWNQLVVDSEKLRIAIHEYKVGSILNVATGAFTVQQWHNIITAIQDSAANTSLKIPILYGIDSIHGANYIRNAVLFPQGIGLAATFNPSLARDLGRITANQTRAAGIPWNFYPQVDIGRQKLWPRIWETFGEDVKLVKDMGRAYTEGLQGDDLTSRSNVAACLKHYVGYGFPLTGQDRTPAWIDERNMHEYFLPPFEESVRAGAASVMINSGDVNGIPGHANYHLITEILKQSYEFQGFVVSDWEDIKRLYTRDRTASSGKDAVRQAIMAGVDMSMVPFDFSFFNYTLEAIRDGSIPRSRIDDAVRRILRVKYALGLFDGRNAWPDTSAINTFNQSSYDEKNLEAAQQVVTLLKNDQNALPLNKDSITPNKPILVTGPTADLVTVLNGGWSYTWQGSDPSIYPEHYRNKTILRSLMNALPTGTVTYAPMPSFDQLPDINSLLNAANDASYVIVCLGEKSYTETVGNINQLTLDDAQLELVERLRSRTGVPIITVLVEGRPRIIRRIVNISSAIIMMYLPGMEGGQALTNVLLGEYNPNGRLPITYPRYEHRLTNYDYRWNEINPDNTIEVEFEFGFGLSYTTFNYANLKVPLIVQWNETIKITVDVSNTGSKAGYHTILLFVSDSYRTVMPPNKELKGYKKEFFNPSQTKTIEFTLTRQDLSFIGIDMKRQTEAGEFMVTVGDLESKFELKQGDEPNPSEGSLSSSISRSIIFIHLLTICFFEIL